MNVQLNRVLDEIKANLRLEQKRVMELNFVLVHRVLSPIQVLPTTAVAFLSIPESRTQLSGRRLHASPAQPRAGPLRAALSAAYSAAVQTAPAALSEGCGPVLCCQMSGTG